MKYEKTFEDAKKELMALQAKISAYNHAMGLMYYDGVTTAPKGTAENRAHSLSILSEEMYRCSTSPETLKLLEFLDEQLKQVPVLEDSKDPADHTAAYEDRKLRRMVYLMLIKDN